jgi:hypothetical protein
MSDRPPNAFVEGDLVEIYWYDASNHVGWHDRNNLDGDKPGKSWLVRNHTVGFFYDMDDDRIRLFPTESFENVGVSDVWVIPTGWPTQMSVIRMAEDVLKQREEIFENSPTLAKDLQGVGAGENGQDEPGSDGTGS